MIKPAEVQDLVRRLAREDMSGLYEIIVGLNTAHPEESEAAKIEAVRPVLRELIERRKLQLGWVEWPEGVRPMPVETAAAILLLDDPRSWRAGERHPVLIAQAGW